MFIARCELIPYITRIRFVLTRLILPGTFTLPTGKSGDSRICRQRDSKTRRTIPKFLKKIKWFTYGSEESRDGPVGKVTSIRGERPRNRSKILGGRRDFQFSKWPRPKMGPTQALIQWKSGGEPLSLLADRQGVQLTNPTIPSSGDFYVAWECTSILSRVVMVWPLMSLRDTFVLFCTMTNNCTIISQIITLLHVSTLSCHPQGTCNQYLAKLHKCFKCNCW